MGRNLLLPMLNKSRVVAMKNPFMPVRMPGDGQDAGQDWNGKDNAAKTAENLVRDPARCPGVILLEQFLVGNIAGHAKGYQGIKYGAAYNGKQHQVAGL